MFVRNVTGKNWPPKQHRAPTLMFYAYLYNLTEGLYFAKRVGSIKRYQAIPVTVVSVAK